MLPQYYDIIIKDNDLATVEKIDYDQYNYFKSIFNYVYHTESGETYPLHKNLDAGIDMLIVDGDHLYELLDDLRDQGFYDPDFYEPEGGDWMNYAYMNYKLEDTYMIIIFHANGEEHIRSKNKVYLDSLQKKLEKRGISSYVVKTAGKVN